MLMRARLSDPSARGPLGCRYLGMLAPREAVNEAWAILAENEPHTGHIGPTALWPSDCYFQTDGTLTEEHAILAASLAALCDTPDVAAYLADLQTR